MYGDIYYFNFPRDEREKLRKFVNKKQIFSQLNKKIGENDVVKWDIYSAVHFTIILWPSRAFCSFASSYEHCNHGLFTGHCVEQAHMQDFVNKGINVLVN